MAIGKIKPDAVKIAGMSFYPASAIKERKYMLASIEGVYRNGKIKIELSETPNVMGDNVRVIVTFLGH